MEDKKMQGILSKPMASQKKGLFYKHFCHEIIIRGNRPNSIRQDNRLRGDIIEISHKVIGEYNRSCDTKAYFYKNNNNTPITVAPLTQYTITKASP